MGKRRNSANLTTDKLDTILIGDDITKYIRMAKTENLTMPDISVQELTELLPTVLSTYPTTMRVIIHIGSCDILRRKTGSEILKKDFSKLLKKIENLQQEVSISGPIPTLGKGSESFSRLLGLNMWLTSACLDHGIKFIDNFNVFWNCKDRFRLDGVHPNVMGCRLLGANIRHDAGMPLSNKTSKKHSIHRQSIHSFIPASPVTISRCSQELSLARKGAQHHTPLLLPSLPHPHPPQLYPPSSPSLHSPIRELVLIKESRVQSSPCPTLPRYTKRALRQLPHRQTSCPLTTQSTKNTK